MTKYRRDSTAGGSWFFTVNLADRQSMRLVDEIQTLRTAFGSVRARHPFDVNAIVVLPDHIHAIWTLPEGDADYAVRWRLIKTIFSRAQPPIERRSESRTSKHERGIWQRRFWEHLIRDESGYRASCRILLYQSGEAWAGATRASLAAPYLAETGGLADLSGFMPLQGRGGTMAKCTRTGCRPVPTKVWRGSEIGCCTSRPG